MRVKTVWVSWLLNACQETGLMQQTKLICRRVFERKDHYRLQSYAEALLYFAGKAPAPVELGAGICNYPMIDVPIQAVPYEAGVKVLHHLHISAAGPSVV